MRRLSWPLILFQLVWLNVVLPGHTRGMITVGRACETESAGCCSKKAKTPASQSPTPDQQKRCAVCAFAAALFTPPALDVSLDLLGVGRSIAISHPTSAPAPDLFRANRERAPPAACA